MFNVSTIRFITMTSSSAAYKLPSQLSSSLVRESKSSASNCEFLFHFPYSSPILAILSRETSAAESQMQTMCNGAGWCWDFAKSIHWRDDQKFQSAFSWLQMTCSRISEIRTPTSISKIFFHLAFLFTTADSRLRCSLRTRRSQRLSSRTGQGLSILSS